MLKWLQFFSWLWFYILVQISSISSTSPGKRFFKTLHRLGAPEDRSLGKPDTRHLSFHSRKLCSCIGSSRLLSGHFCKRCHPRSLWDPSPSALCASSSTNHKCQAVDDLLGSWWQEPESCHGDVWRFDTWDDRRPKTALYLVHVLGCRMEWTARYIPN